MPFLSASLGACYGMWEIWDFGRAAGLVCCRCRHVATHCPTAAQPYFGFLMSICLTPKSFPSSMMTQMAALSIVASPSPAHAEGRAHASSPKGRR